MNLEDEIL